MWVMWAIWLDMYSWTFTFYYTYLFFSVLQLLSKTFQVLMYFPIAEAGFLILLIQSIINVRRTK